LLTPEQRRAALVMLGLMLIGMVLETVGIGLVIPAVALMTQANVVENHPVLMSWISSLGNPSQERLVIAGVLILVGVYAAKALFLAFLAWRQMKFVYGVQAELSQRLYAGYLRQPYTFHLQRNSAQLIRNVVTEINLFTHTGLTSGMTFLTELLVLLGVSALLLAVEPLGALLVVSTLCLAGWGFSRLTRNPIIRWGEARQHHDGLRIQHLQQGLGGVKDVKLLGRETEFLAQYRAHNDGNARFGQRQATLQQLPRLWLELLAVVGLATLVLIMIWQDKPLEGVLPTLGLFAAVAFRLMPSANRVLTAIQNIRYALPVIETLYSEIRLLNEADITHRRAPLPFKTELVLDHVNFSYPAADTQALRNVALSIPRGASVGFIGGSGAGKSTLVDIILGLLTPDSGTVTVDGIDVQSNVRGWQDQVGYVPQSIYLTDDTLRRNVAFGIPNDQIDEAAVWRAIRAAQLDDFVDELPQGLDTEVGERGIRLSGGQRQRIGIARALYHDPSVLVLDEATSSLDTQTEGGVMDAVRALRGDKTLIIVAHRLSTVEHCDCLFRLDRGQVVEAGDTAGVLRSNTEKLAKKT
jgi:ATP-binding cassette, subfamily B, bacterial PglK